MLYEARDLADIVAHFEKLAQTANNVASTAPFARARAAAYVEATTWREAAAVIRSTKLISNKTPEPVE